MRRIVAVSAVGMLLGCDGKTDFNFSKTSNRAWNVGNIEVLNPYLVEPAGDAPAAMYFTVTNKGGATDSLLSVQVAGVPKAELHVTMPTSHSGGSMDHSAMMMTPVAGLEVPAHGKLALSPGGA